MESVRSTDTYFGNRIISSMTKMLICSVCLLHIYALSLASAQSKEQENFVGKQFNKQENNVVAPLNMNKNVHRKTNYTIPRNSEIKTSTTVHYDGIAMINETVISSSDYSDNNGMKNNLSETLSQIGFRKILNKYGKSNLKTKLPYFSHLNSNIAALPNTSIHKTSSIESLYIPANDKDDPGLPYTEISSDEIAVIDSTVESTSSTSPYIVSDITPALPHIPSNNISQASSYILSGISAASPYIPSKNISATSPVVINLGKGHLAYLRSVRSPNDPRKSGWNGDKIKPVTCVLSSLCSERKDQITNSPNSPTRLPCHCDDHCYLYGDCCYDLQQEIKRKNTHHQGNKDINNTEKENELMSNRSDTNTDDISRGNRSGKKREKEEGKNEMKRKEGNAKKKFPSTITQDFWSCRYLSPLIHRPYSNRKVIYMVTKCPLQAPKSLSDKCNLDITHASTQQYLMDIAVVSADSGIVYKNIFCAKCHKDSNINTYDFQVTCSETVNSLQNLSKMTYHPGELKWSSKEDNTDKDSGSDTTQSRLQSPSETSTITCLIDIMYNDSDGRQCELNLIDTCSNYEVEKSIERQCSSYNYYVTVKSKVYKNWHCALCNNQSENEIKCLPIGFYFLKSSLIAPPPSLTDLFNVEGKCAENQIWNLLYNRCENVFCGSLFTLKDGECLRNNETIKEGQSYLNSSCYTHEFLREYSVILENGSVYLNHTQVTYNKGEYEFINHTWIRVCRPPDRWTPVMNIVSTVLISISLVCMVLHMLIFFLLPNRRNIPSMNLFSMTLSLFFTELVFVSLFYYNENYVMCVLVAIIIYYFLSASFMWMNVMSIDICRTFHSKTYKTKSRKIFIQYSIYAWSVPMVSTLIAILIDQFTSPEFILRPEFGTDRCWFNQKWGLVTFFTLPSGLIVLINIGLYGISVYDIYKQYKYGEFASSTVKKNGSSMNKRRYSKENEKFLKPPNTEDNSRNSDSDSPRYAERFRDRIQRRIHANKKQRVRLVLYCKLAIIMGLTWIFAFVSFHTNSLVFEYLFIIFNGLQGTFIFIAFDCKQKLWDELRLKVTGKRIRRFVTKTSSLTKETALSSSSEGQYRYRWSSNRNQDGNRKSSLLSHSTGEPLMKAKDSSVAIS